MTRVFEKTRVTKENRDLDDERSRTSVNGKRAPTGPLRTDPVHRRNQTVASQSCFTAANRLIHFHAETRLLYQSNQTITL